MKAILLPIVILLVAVGSGVAAGLVLKPEPTQVGTNGFENCIDPETMSAVAPAPVAETEPRDYAKLNNQFVIPVVQDGVVAALVVMSLNIEVTAGSQSIIFAAEPKLRDRFLQVMFDHANIGGFSGNFTIGTNMRVLRNELLRAAQDVSGSVVTDVLVIDIVRQDS